jgi:carboxypeptidase family protein/polysaccharide lyase family 4-like protein
MKPRNGVIGFLLFSFFASPSILLIDLCHAGSVREAKAGEKVDDAPPNPSALKVVDSSGKPILRAQINRDGNLMRVSAEGFLPWTGALQSGEKGPSRIVLLRPGSLRGRVLSQGSPVKKFVVGLKAGGTLPAPSRSPSTDGAYRLELLPPGLHTIALEAEGFVPIERRVALREGEARWVDFALSRAAWLAAKVVGGDGKPLPGVAVSIRTEGPDGRFLDDDEKKRLNALQGKSDEKGSILLGPLAWGVRHRIVFRRMGSPVRSLILTPATPLVSREVRLPQGAEILLRLRDSKKKPITGAAAFLSSDDAMDVDLLPDPPASNAEGILKIAALQAGKYSIRIQAKGFVPTTLRERVVKEGEAIDLGEIRLEPGLEIAGTVRDEAGSPVVGASVNAKFFEEGRRLSAKDEADREGRFRISGLPSGNIDIRTEAKGFFANMKEQVAAGTQNLELKMIRQGSLSGQILDDRSGLPVTVFQMEWSPETAPGFTPLWSYAQWRAFEDAEGRFRIEDLRPQSYSLRVKARGYKPAVQEGIRVDASDSAPVQFRMETGAMLRGIVLDAETREPVAGATARAAGLYPVETDSEGAFSLQGVEGKFTLIITHPSYPAAEVPDVTSGRTEPLEILLSKGGSVEGIVYGQNGDPLPGAEVSTPQQDRHADRTDAAGHYRLEGLPAGQRVLTKVDVPGTYEGFESQTVEVRVGQSSVLDFGVGVSLFGNVTHEGAPASGALLTLAQAPGERSTDNPMRGSRAIRCREDGSYEARGLRAGQYGLVVTWEDRKVGKQIVIPEKTQQSRLDIEIPEIWLSGEVLDRQTRLPLRGTVLAWKPDSHSASYTTGFEEGDESITFSSNPQFRGELDAQGRYRIALMEMGTYRVTAYVPGYRMEKPVEFEVTASRSHLELALEPAIQLTVHAEESSTKRSLQAVCVMLLSEAHRETHCGIGEGYFDAMRPGKIKVAVMVPGYAVGIRDIELREEKEEVTVPVMRGGTLRIRLPASVERDAERIRQTARLGIEDSNGVELTELMASRDAGGSWILFPDSGEAVVTHVPPGRLSVRIGGDGTSLTLKQEAIELGDDGEAEVDLR